MTGSMPERLITPLIVTALLLGTLLALRSTNSSTVTPVPVSSVAALTLTRFRWSSETNRSQRSLREPAARCATPFRVFQGPMGA